MVWEKKDSGDEPDPPNSPQTGDDSMIRLWVTIAVISAMGIIAICIEQRRNKAVK